MKKCILEITEEEGVDFEKEIAIYLKAPDMVVALWRIDQNLTSHIKHGEGMDIETLQKVRKDFLDVLNQLSLSDLIFE